MTSTHRIIELLAQGVAPTESEVNDLEGVGRFASSMYERYHGGLGRSGAVGLGDKSIRWSDRIAESLSARTAERWSEGLGLGSDLLDGGWLGPWGSSQAANDGYAWFDQERESIRLEEELPSESVSGSVESGVRRRRRSLFGAPSRPPVRNAAYARGDQKPVALRHGGTIAHDAVQALEAGGLFLGDQVVGDSGRKAAPSARTDPAGRRLAQSRPRVTLDGLHIGDATPGLSGALAWAEGVFGEHSASSPLAVTSGALSRMLGHDAFGLSADAHQSRRSPVFGFFDSVEGEFVALKEEKVVPATADGPTSTARQGATPQVARPLTAPGTQAVTRLGAPGPSVGGAEPDGLTATQSLSMTQRGAAAEQVGGTPRPAGGSPVRTGLKRIVSPRERGAESPRLRPYTGGVFPQPVESIRPIGSRASAGLAVGDRGRGVGRSMSQRPRFASEFVADRAGQPRARVQRGAMSAPRIALVGADAGGAGEQDQTRLGLGEQSFGPRRWVTAADMGPDLPLAASLSRHESMAGMLAAERTQLPSASMGFEPLMSRPHRDGGARRQRPRRGLVGDAALDGVVWLSMPTEPGELTPELHHELSPTSLIPHDRRASMVPAHLALQQSIDAASVLQRALPGAQQPGAQQPGSPGAQQPGSPGAQQPGPPGAHAYRGTTGIRGSGDALSTAVPGMTSVASRAALQRSDVEYFARSGVWIDPGHLAGRMLHRMGDVEGLSDDVIASGLPERLMTRGRPEQMASDGTGLMVEALSARWMAGDGSDGAVEAWSPRASRSVPTDLGRGVYASGRRGLDVTMVTSPEEAQVESPAGSALSSQRRIVPPDRPERTIIAPLRPVASERALARMAGDVDARSAKGTDVGQQLMYDAEQRLSMRLPDQHQTLSAPWSSSGVGEGVSASTDLLGTGYPATAVARGARAALQRPVSTSREVLAVSSLIEGLGAQASQVAGGSFSRAGAEEPGLQSAGQPHLLAHLQALRSEGQARLWSGVMSDSAARFAAQVASMTPGQSTRVSQALRLAGWREPELRMLRLGSGAPDEGDAPRSLSSGPAAKRRVDPSSADERATSRATRPRQQPKADTRRMARSLARILTGAEALSGGVTGAVAAESLLGAGHSFVMPTYAEKYFASNAPTRGRSAWTADLMDAVGELVTLAESNSAEGATAGRDGLLAVIRRAQQLKSLWKPQGGDTGAHDVPPALRSMMSTPPDLDVSSDTWSPRGADPALVGVLDPDMMVAAQPLGAPQGLGDGALASGYRRFGQDELQMLELPTDERPDSAVDAQRGEAPRAHASRLASRVSDALAASASGPAGADRLTRSLRPGGAGALGAGRDEMSVVDSEQLSLGAALAPEAMLSGMRAESFGRRPGRGRRHRLAGGGLPGELTTLTGAAPTSAAQDSTAGRDGASEGRRAADAERQKTARLVAATLRRAGVVEGQLGSGLLHGLVARLERTASGGSLRRGEIADFTMAWLERIDGSRTGLDMGLDGVRDDVVSAVGAWASSRRSSRLAGRSPIDEASTVGLPAEERGTRDRSGLRRASLQGSSGASVASRPRHRAASALKQADWKFVDTGSREGTSHAELGQLAAKIMEIVPSAGEAPMPLVAPAVKAVAQTALRKGRDESLGGGDASSGGADAAVSSPGGDSGAASVAGKLSKAAFEKLAYEMADRVARRLKREQERKGQWP
jgi:hypothetical protein